MSSARLPRSIRAIIEQAGLTVVSYVCNSHWKVRVRAPDGREMQVIMAVTASDHRAEKNKLAQLRKFAKGAP